MEGGAVKTWGAMLFLALATISVILFAIGILMESPYIFLAGFAGIIFLACMSASKTGDPEWQAKKLAAEARAHDHGW